MLGSICGRLIGRAVVLASKFPHEAVAVGGTFDILHVGHESLLGKAFEIGEIVYIGVSGDTLVSVLHKDHAVRPFAKRKIDLMRFLRARGWLQRARIVELKDPFGPATRRKSLEALVVSEETRSNGRKVNRIRRQKGLNSLQIYVVNMIMAEDGKPISVTRIRKGELDPDGRLL